MAFEADGVDNPQELEIAISGPFPANRLFIYTGTMQVSSGVNPDDNIGHTTVFLNLGKIHNRIFNQTSLILLKTAPTVSLASISWNDDADSAIWAVDHVHTELEGNGHLLLYVDYGVGGTNCGLAGLGYQVNVLVASQEPELLSLTLNPPTVQHADSTSQGTVTMSGPVPANDVVVISLSSGKPSLVTVPSSVAVASGQTTAIFNATVITELPENENVNITASFKGVNRTAILTVLGVPH